MRIGIDAHTIGQQQTGNETYTRNLIENISTLAPRDMELYFYHTMRHDQFEHGKWKGRIRQVVPANAAIRIPLSFPVVTAIDKLDLMHYNYVAPPVSPCPTIITIHDISYEYYPEYFNPLSRARMRLLIPYSAKKARHVLTISEFSYREIIKRYRLPESRVTTVPLGVSELFRVIDDQAILDDVRKKFHLNSPFILAVGNLQPRKNLERLINAYARLRQHNRIENKLVLVGKKHWKGHRIEQLIEDHGLQNDIIRTGYVTHEDLVALYNLADLFAFPTLYEGFGLPVLEAMKCETPVVSSNVASIPEVAGDAAILVDPMSEDEIASAIEKVLSSKQLQKSMIEKGVTQAAKFTWTEFGSRMVDIYRSCVE